MAMRERQELAGRVSIVLRDPARGEVARYRFDNLITSAGRTLLANALTGAVQIQSQYLSIDVGTGTVAPAVTDTALNARADGAAAQIGPPKLVSDAGGQRVVATVSATLPATGAAAAQALTEAGIAIALPGAAPVLYNRVVFPVISRAGNLEMTLSWEVMF